MRFENPITVQAGSRKVTLYSDIEILVDGRPEIIIDAKKPSHTINDTDVLQVTSYAKLVDVQSAYCAFVTNGHDLKGVNVSTGAAMPGIPSKNQLISSLSRRPKNILTGIQLREVRSTLVTIMSQDVLYRVIKECKDIIEKQALIRSDQSFKEMTKILLVKMNEERRALKEARENRFSRQWLQVSAEASGAQQLEVFRKLFEEATNKYSGIYDDDDVSIQIKDEDALLKSWTVWNHSPSSARETTSKEPCTKFSSKRRCEENSTNTSRPVSWSTTSWKPPTRNTVNDSWTRLPVREGS